MTDAKNRGYVYKVSFKLICNLLYDMPMFTCLQSDTTDNLQMHISYNTNIDLITNSFKRCQSVVMYAAYILQQARSRN